ncbi:MAG: hypothetical protein NZT92_16820 [Abditibacteriales bacterium]|nr:hypothetical protein [Abditibacteriales bacterium]
MKRSADDLFQLVLLLLVILFMPTQWTLGQLGPEAERGAEARKINIAIGDVVVTLAFLAWAARTTARREWKTARLPPLPCWLFVAVAVLSAVHCRAVVEAVLDNPHPLKLLKHQPVREALTEVVEYTLYLIVTYMLLVNLLRDEQRWRVGVYWFCTVTTAVMALGVFEWFATGMPFAVTATFGSRNIFNGFLVMALPLLFALARHSDRRVRRWLAATGVVGIVTLLPGLFPLTVLHDEEGDIKKQYIEWQAALNMMEDTRENNFLLGVGTGNYQLNIGRYYGFLPNKEKMPRDSHNLYLVLGGSMGLLGLVTWIWILTHHLQLAHTLRRQTSDAWQRGVATGLCGSLWALAFINLFHALLVRGTGLVMVFLWALLTAMNDLRQVERDLPE